MPMEGVSAAVRSARVTRMVVDSESEGEREATVTATNARASCCSLTAVVQYVGCTKVAVEQTVR